MLSLPAYRRERYSVSQSTGAWHQEPLPVMVSWFQF